MTRWFSWLLWWSQSGSNRRPSRCKRDALPAELWPLYQWAEIVETISADITPSSVGKKRGFCPLLLRGAEIVETISADITPSSVGKKRGFCPLRLRGAEIVETISANITPSSVGKKRGFCPLRLRRPPRVSGLGSGGSGRS